MSQIVCEDVALGYEGKTVIEQVSFNVEQGDYLCVVGENGSGKSTLIKALLRIIPPISGRISTGEGLRSSEIGYLPQQTAVQRDFPASVKEVILSGCLNRCGIRPYYNKEEKKLAIEHMDKLNIRELANRCYRELSGGQQQRVLLARALCAAQKILLLDEPVAGLDPKASQDLYAAIQRLNHEDGITVIMVSHDTASVVQYASHILHLSHRPLFFGRKDSYLQSDIGKTFLAIMGGDKN